METVHATSGRFDHCRNNDPARRQCLFLARGPDQVEMETLIWRRKPLVSIQQHQFDGLFPLSSFKHDKVQTTGDFLAGEVAPVPCFFICTGQ